MIQLDHEFTVPVPVDEAWAVLLDVERITPCMPGASLLTVDGDDFTGTVKVKVGPITVTYNGTARFAEKDVDAHRAVIEATGKETRGAGTAAATVTATLTDDGGTTRVAVHTDLNVTGKPAQFGRGVLAEVGAKLVGQFADCLADELGNAPGVTSTPAEPPPAKKTAKKAPAKKVAAKTAPPPPPDPAKKTAAKKTAKKAPAKKAPPAPAVPPPTPDVVPAGAAYVAPGEPESVRDVRAASPRPIPRPAAEPIDLLDVAGGSIAKRVAPVAVALVLLLLLLRRRRLR